jgi:glycerophosphoryl diester phosphodiesterase
VVGQGAPADGAKASYAEMLTPAGLAEIATYAAGLGPEKSQVIAADGKATSLVADAHAAGLEVHPWTMRAENVFLSPIDRAGEDPAAHGRLRDEIARQIAAGVDGFFTDFPYDGVAARDAAVRSGK